MAQPVSHDHVYWNLSEVTSRVVAKSGVPTDRYHLGKIVLQSFKDDLDFVAQIDGGTGESETNGSLLKRSVQCAISFREMGLKRGDVMILMAPNHLDIAVPFYAAFYLGIVIATIDRGLKTGELEHMFNIYKPSIVMCQSEKIPDVRIVLDTLNINAAIITFDEQKDGPCLTDLLKATNEEVNNFEAEDLDPEESVAVILCTSGSTGGLPKGAALTYKTFMITGPHLWARFIKYLSPTHLRLILSPLQWLSATVHFIMSPFLKYSRLQTSSAATPEHTRHLINKYKPTAGALSPTMLLGFLKSEEKEHCDMTCFDVIFVAGGALDQITLDLMKAKSPKTTMINAYGLTELSTVAFHGDCPQGSCGKPSEIYEHRLINLATQEDITEPHVNGELWLRGPMFKGYYNNPEETKEAFSEDGWFKTGDLFYRDEHWNYFFVERIKLLLDYTPAQMISPTEIEGVIRLHPNVMDVAVIGIPHPELVELPAACVIPKPGCNLNAQEIKDLVKEKLSDPKQLRGGVAFVSSFPLTITHKINRKKLNEIAKNMKFE